MERKTETEGEMERERERKRGRGRERKRGREERYERVAEREHTIDQLCLLGCASTSTLVRTTYTLGTGTVCVPVVPE